MPKQVAILFCRRSQVFVLFCHRSQLFVLFLLSFANICIVLLSFASMCIVLLSFASICIVLPSFANIFIVLLSFASICFVLLSFASICTVLLSFASICIVSRVHRTYRCCLCVVILCCVLFRTHKHIFGFPNIHFYSVIACPPSVSQTSKVGHKLTSPIQVTFPWFPWTVLRAYSKAPAMKTSFGYRNFFHFGI